MKWSRLFVFACVVASTAPSVAQERIALPIEIVRSGAIIARPQLNLQPGLQGRLNLNGAVPGSPQVLQGLNEDVSLIPTVRGDEITLVFSITSGDRKLTPTMVISKDVRGSLEWKAADGQPIVLTVAWGR